MGMFRDLKGTIDVARSDELKDMRQMAQARPRCGPLPLPIASRGH